MTRRRVGGYARPMTKPTIPGYELLEMTRQDLTDRELDAALDDLHDFIECQCGPGPYRDRRHEVVASLAAEVRRRRLADAGGDPAPDAVAGAVSDHHSFGADCPECGDTYPGGQCALYLLAGPGAKKFLPPVL